MKTNNQWIVKSLVAVILASAILTTPAIAKTTITGVINESYEIVTDNGDVYEVGDTAIGEKLATTQVGNRVTVTGEVTETTDFKTIDVEHYTVAPDDAREVEPMEEVESMEDDFEDSGEMEME